MIDGRIYVLTRSETRMTTAQRDLYRIIYAIGAVGGKVRSHELMRFMGLTRLEAYESRLNHLIKKGYLKREEQTETFGESQIA